MLLGIGVAMLAYAETRAHWLSTSSSNQGFDPISTSLIGVIVSQLAIGVLGALVMSAEYGTGTIRRDSLRYDQKLWITHPFGDATYLPR